VATGKSGAHFTQIYDAQVREGTISRITDKTTDKTIEELRPWQSRRLDSVGSEKDVLGFDLASAAKVRSSGGA